MSTLKEIYGKTVKVLSSDPTDAGAEGQIWYNSTSGTFKSVVVGEAWSSVSPLSEGRSLAGAAGTSPAGLAFGGEPGPASPAETTATEEWNGSGWSTGGVLNTARRAMASFGTQTAAVAAAGTAGGTLTELYNGSTWTNTGHATPYAGNNMQGSGTSTAGLMYGGPPILTTTVEYDGSSWTGGGAMGNGRMQFGGSPQGTQTASLAVSGLGPPAPGTLITAVEDYNGSSWSGGTAIGSGKYRQGSAGSSTANLQFAGYGGPTLTATTFKYDGTSWTTAPNVSTANQQSSGFGNQNAAYMVGGNPPSAKNTVEEFNITTNIITPGAWASGGALNTARDYLSASSAGTQDATVVFGGNSPGNTAMNNSESYNGSSWTATPTLNFGRRMGGGAGTQTAALAFGGYRDAPAGPPSGHLNITESWNGSSWTALPGTMPVAVNLFASFGTQTAAIAATGTSSPGVMTQVWNGSAWTTSPGNVNTGRFDLAGCGTTTAGLIFGGLTPPGGPPYTPSSVTEEWNGSAWTAGSALGTARRGVGGAGIQTAALAFGGGPPAITSTEGYDGSSWSTRPSLATGRYTTAGSGTQTSALASGGATTVAVTNTEEFTGETVTANPASNITTS